MTQGRKLLGYWYPEEIPQIQEQSTDEILRDLRRRFPEVFEAAIKRKERSDSSR